MIGDTFPEGIFGRTNIFSWTHNVAAVPIIVAGTVAAVGVNIDTAAVADDDVGARIVHIGATGGRGFVGVIAVAVFIDDAAGVGKGVGVGGGIRNTFTANPVSVILIRRYRRPQIPVTGNVSTKPTYVDRKFHESLVCVTVYGKLSTTSTFLIYWSTEKIYLNMI